MMRSVLWLCIGVVLAGICVYGFSHVGRYQIQPARVLYGSETFDRLFRIDTATGKTWTLMTRTDGKDYWWPVDEPQARR
jgi:hypothetical protein